LVNKSSIFPEASKIFLGVIIRHFIALNTAILLAHAYINSIFHRAQQYIRNNHHNHTKSAIITYMCGIFGAVGNHYHGTGVIHSALKELFLLSESRGKEASGFAITNKNTLYVHRAPHTASILVREKEFTDAMAVLSTEKNDFAFIGHSRLATNGSPYRDKNNQPVISKESALIHNGILVNAAELWQKYYPNKPQPELDTMILARLLDTLIKRFGFDVRRALNQLYKEIYGETSIAFLTLKKRALFLATNTGSIYYVRTSSGLFLFSSERYITETVLSRLRLHGSVTQLKPGQYKTIQFGQIASYIVKRITKPPLFTTSSHLFRNKLSLLQTHIPDNEAISRIPRCTKCILPATMPLISFDKDGVCNFCNTYAKQQPKGENALLSLVNPYRNNQGKANCIVALSGGRDSSYGLHYVKNILKLNPIAYTYDWGMITDVARRNQSRMVSALGVEHVWVSADIEYKRKNIHKNVEAWLAKPDVAMVPLFMAGDKQAEYYVEELKRKTGINLVIYCRGNQLEDERFKFGYYGIFDGTPKGVIHNLALSGKLSMALYFAKACLTNPQYINSSLADTAFAYASSYLIPHKHFLYLWHYIPWKENLVVSTLKNTYGWETPNDTTATWRIDDGTPPFYNYIYYHVQGFTEHDGLRSNQIREGHITRKSALSLVQEENKPRYESLKWYFDLISIDGDRALSIIDKMPTRYGKIRQ